MCLPATEEKVSRKTRLDASLIQKCRLGGRKEEPRGEREIAGQERAGFRDAAMSEARKQIAEGKVAGAPTRSEWKDLVGAGPSSHSS